MTRIAIAGARGRMGRMLIEAVQAAPDMTLAVALGKPGAPEIGLDATEFLGQTSGVIITDQLDALANADCLIDFTRPEGTLAHLEACRRHGVHMVIGTTGFDEAGKQAIARFAEEQAVVFAPNMSVGVNVTFKLLEVAASILKQDYDVEIFELHHKHKVDAPSGTALGMGEVVAKAWGKDLNEVAEWARHGLTGERKAGSIGFSSGRGGDVVGDHTAFFCGPGERIEISHRSASRQTYAEGSVRAARFLSQQQRGLFDMQDVLGLK
ncbi:MAG: 4-hydroxy-tetrahydrodipicolinate reductase [Pigmentiphaga sp.]